MCVVLFRSYHLDPWWLWGSQCMVLFRSYHVYREKCLDLLRSYYLYRDDFGDLNVWFYSVLTTCAVMTLGLFFPLNTKYCKLMFDSERYKVCGWWCSSVVKASDGHAADASSIPRCGKGFFSQSQLSVQTLLRVSIHPRVKLYAFTSVCTLKIL